MKFYKIRHKSSGLFYKPANGDINVSKAGKVYQSKPSINRLKSDRILMGYGDIGNTNQFKGEEIWYTFDKLDWEIVEYQTRELVVTW